MNKQYTQILDESVVCLDLAATSAEAVIAHLVQQAIDQGKLDNAYKADAVQAILRRECSASTAMPGGIALPHGRVDFISDMICMIGIHHTGVDSNSPDNATTHIFVQLLVPATAGTAHIHFLANISKPLLMPEAVEKLLLAKTREEVFQQLTK